MGRVTTTQPLLQVVPASSESTTFALKPLAVAADQQRIRNSSGGMGSMAMSGFGRGKTGSSTDSGSPSSPAGGGAFGNLIPDVLAALEKRTPAQNA